MWVRYISTPLDWAIEHQSIRVLLKHKCLIRAAFSTLITAIVPLFWRSIESKCYVENAKCIPSFKIKIRTAWDIGKFNFKSLLIKLLQNSRTYFVSATIIKLHWWQNDLNVKYVQGGFLTGRTFLMGFTV